MGQPYLTGLARWDRGWEFSFFGKAIRILESSQLSTMFLVYLRRLFFSPLHPLSYCQPATMQPSVKSFFSRITRTEFARTGCVKGQAKIMALDGICIL